MRCLCLFEQLRFLLMQMLQWRILHTVQPLHKRNYAACMFQDPFAYACMLQVQTVKKSQVSLHLFDTFLAQVGVSKTLTCFLSCLLPVLYLIRIKNLQTGRLNLQCLVLFRRSYHCVLTHLSELRRLSLLHWSCIKYLKHTASWQAAYQMASRGNTFEKEHHRKPSGVSAAVFLKKLFRPLNTFYY